MNEKDLLSAMGNITPDELVARARRMRRQDNAIAIAIVFVLGTVGLLLVASAARGDHADPFPAVEDRVCIPSYYQLFPFGTFQEDYFFEDDRNWFCYREFWAGAVGIHATRAEILETGGHGFGFTMTEVSPLPLGTGASNSTFVLHWWAEWIFDTGLRLDGAVNGAQYHVDFVFNCFVFVIGFDGCQYYPNQLTLGGGWVTDNGIDFSNTSYPITPTFPGAFEGAGQHFPFYPFSPEFFEFEPEPIVMWNLRNRAPIRVELEPFFGITFQISFEQGGRVDNVPAPEPGFAIGLAVCAAWLVALSRKRV